MLKIEKNDGQYITESQEYLPTNDESERENSNFTVEEHGSHKINYVIKLNVTNTEAIWHHMPPVNGALKSPPIWNLLGKNNFKYVWSKYSKKTSDKPKLRDSSQNYLLAVLKMSSSWENNYG